MTVYLRNRSCPCQRCRAKGLLAAAVLITVGILSLLENYNVIDWDKSWPILLIVIGLCLFASRTASVAGHIQPFGLPGPAPSSSAPPYPDQQNNPQVKS